MALRRSPVQSSRSASDGHLVNAIALKKYEPELTNISYSRNMNWTGFEGHGLKGQGHTNGGGTHRRFTVDWYL